MEIITRKNESCAPDYSLFWDSVWDADRGAADWALSDGSEPYNRGGLQAKHAIETAATLALFTDKRVDPAHPLFFLADGDPRGYWGDGIDVRADRAEAELGSLLWLLERAPLTIRNVSVARWAEVFALEALAPLQLQGAVVRIEAEATARELQSRLDLIVRLYGRDGKLVFDRKFDLLWNQVAR